MRADESDRRETPGAPRRRPLLFAVLALAVLLVLGLGLRALYRSTAPAVRGDVPAAVPLAPEKPASRPAPAPSPPPEALTTLPAPQSYAPPLPALEDSDAEVRAALSDILPPLAEPALAQGELLRRLAVLAAGFGRGKLLRDKLPLPAPGGRLVVVTRDDRTFLAAANFQRYDALADAVAGLDTGAIARWFDRYEPLLQQAWNELGHGEGSARGALIAGLDLLLAAPDLEGEIELVQPSVFYRYADPALEALPDTQKLLLRIGPNNRLLVKQRARRLREALAAPTVI